MFSTGFTSFSVFFFLIRSPFLSYIDEAPSINLSAKVFVFGEFNVHHKDFLIVLLQLINLVNCVVIFLPYSDD